MKRIRLDGVDPVEKLRVYSEPNAEGCLVWMRGRTKDGYGWLSINGGRQVYAHRFAYETYVGPIPAGMVIDHRCRNRACVNHEHMEVVTRAENTRRGGPVSGERNGHAKLTEQDVRAIRDASPKTKEEQERIAERYGVSPSAISHVIRRSTWSHLEEVAA